MSGAPMSAIKLALASHKLRQNEQDMQVLAAEPIAIVGLGCRLPGGVVSPDAFWMFLENGGDAITPVPAARWDADAYYDPDPAAPGKINTRFGGFVDSIDKFDPMVFGIAPREAIHMDPQQRLLLEVAWEAFDDAGLPLETLRGSRTGVFFGVCNGDYGRLQLEHPASISAHSLSGTAPSIAAGRLSYLYDLRGPSIVVDTACSSSLVALHAAVQSLRARESNLAIAGGVSLNLTPGQTISLAKWGMLAPDGRCKTFDAAANGFVRSEGCAAVVLKRLTDALRDGDRVYAIVRASAVNQDGRSNVLTAPNGEAQREVVRTALAQAQLAPHDVTFVETHGTGTRVGDPIEIEALIDVLGGPRPDGSVCHLGAVKANLGHLEAAAGVAGLMKVVLCLGRGAIPPQVHFHTLNPLVSLDGTSLRIPTVLTPWRRGGKPRIAGVSSFGFSGTNAHVLLEEAPELPALQRTDRAQLLPISAKSVEALQAAVGISHAWLTAAGVPPLADICYTAGARRKHHAYRAAFVATSSTEMRNALDGVTLPLARQAGGPAPQVAFLFSGQGSGWHGMGSGLLRDEPVFAAAIERCDQALRGRVGWAVRDLLRSTETAWLADTERYQVVLFAMQIGLVALWRDWGIEPSAVAGHSVGEIAAAYAAGALSLADALEIVMRRSGLMHRSAPPGAMAAAELTLEAGEALLRAWHGRLVVAAHNGPTAITVAGDAPAIEEFVAHPQLNGRFVRRLNVDRAFHSPAMQIAADEIGRTLQLSPVATRIPMYSSVTANTVSGNELDAAYWARNLRERVRFADTAAALLRDGFRHFVEIGPHPALLPAMGQAGLGTVVNLPSLRSGQDDRTIMLQSLARLYTEGCAVHWRRVADTGAKCTSLPAYPWQKERYWFEPGESPGPKSQPELAPLLGRRIDTPFHAGPIFETLLAEDSPPWIAGHRLAGACMLPATGMIEMALAAGIQTLGAGKGLELVDGLILRALSIPRIGVQRVQIGLTADGERRWRVKIASRADGPDHPWQVHFECVLRATADDIAPISAPPASGGEVDLDGLYARMAARGLAFGDAFRALSSVRHDGQVAVATIRPERRLAPTGYCLFPPLLDACLHVLEPFLRTSTSAWLPVGFASLKIAGQPPALASSAARLNSDVAASATELGADIGVFDAAGQAFVAIRGLRLRAVPIDTLRRLAEPALGNMLHEPVWEAAADAAATKATGSWLLVADSGGVAEQLAVGLRGDGAHCVVLESGPPGTEYQAIDVQRWRIDGHDVGHYRRALREGAHRFDHVVHLAALDARTGDDADPLAAQVRVSQPALAVIQALGGSGAELWLVTCGVEHFTDAKGSLQAPLWGLGAVLDVESPEMRCRMIDLDPGDAASAHGAALLTEARSTDSRENRVAWSDGRRLVERLLPLGPTPADMDPWELRAPASLRIDDLAPFPAGRVAIGPTDVRIEVHAVGLNFRDVMNTLGMLGADAPVLGGECAGIVAEVGSAIEPSLLGARVMAFKHGGFASQVVVPRTQMVRTPAGMGHAEAASLPVAFLTALYGLTDLARLAPGDIVLIHAGAGGVGLAALQVAVACGATVIATAGSAEKRDYLRSLGAQHVFSSRTTEFSAAALQISGGRGVDVVLNSLSGPFVAASFSALRPGGCFVELGKRGVWSPTEAAERRPDVRYAQFDLSEVAAAEPATLSRLFSTLIAGLTAGRYRPIPFRTYGFRGIRDAFDYMARARHIGKLVIRLPEPRVAVPRLRSDATYLITGASGGLGSSVAASLLSRGARHLALLSRTPPGAHASAAYESLRAAGAELEFMQCDLTIPAAVDRAFDAIEASMPPVRGIFHLAGVIDDAPLATLPWARFAAVLAPKIAGTRELERRARRLELDHFMLFSSAAALFGWRGQSAYASGNAYLDAVARRRHAAGLPAVSINWGPWSDSGMAAQTAERNGMNFAERGLGMLSRADTDAAFDRLLESSPPQVVAAWLVTQRLPRGSLLAAIGRQGPDRTPGGTSPNATRATLRTALSAASDAQRPVLVRSAIEREAARALGLKADYRFEKSRPLNDLGLDSLLAVQLANALSELLDTPLPATLLFDHPTIDALSAHLGSPAAPHPPVEAAVPGAPYLDVATLSEAAAEELLVAELDSLGRRNAGP